MKIEIFSLVIISILMVGVGVLIFDHFDEDRRDRQMVIQSSTILKDKEMYDYAVETEQGNIIGETTVKAIGGFKFKEMNQNFTYVEKVKEVYTMHTRRVKVGKHYRTRIYWTWDVKGRESGQAEQLGIFGNKYKTEKFDFPGAKVIDASKIVKKANGRYYKTSPSVRYYYEVAPLKFDAAFFANAKKGTIKPAMNDKKIQLEDKKAKEIVAESQKSKAVLFWAIWALVNLIIALLFLSREQIAEAINYL